MSEASDALEARKAAREARKARLRKVLAEYQARAAALGVDAQEAIGKEEETSATDESEEMTDKVEDESLASKVEAAKDEWEELARIDPTGARRILRRVWLCVSAAALVIGLGVGYFFSDF